MKRKNATRSALFTSVISLLLCVAMLVGTTFAWFTDEVVSGQNTIQAGNLDIDVMYANTPDGTYESIENETDLFVAPVGETKGLWEPGHTEVAYLKVVNNGTLALKYQFMLDEATETTGLTEDGKVIQLSNILKFAATEPSPTAPTAYTRATAQAAAAASTANLLGYSTNVIELGAGESDYIALVVYMPESIGNEANYRGTDIPTINFKLTALATQVEAENDSFGDDYDAGAYLDKVYTAAELISALEQGESVVLGDNITLSTGEQIIVAENDNVTLDLNGKTLAGTDATLPIIVNRGTMVIEGDENSVISLASVTNGKSTVQNYGTMTIKGGTYLGATIGADGQPSYTVTNQAGTLTIEDATIEGIKGIAANGGHVEINDATVISGKDGYTVHALLVYGSASLTVNDGYFENLYGAAGGAIVCDWTTGAIVLNGGTYKYGMLNNDYGMGGPKLSVTGGTYSSKPSSYIADGYQAVANDDGTWAVIPGDAYATTSDELVAAINAAADNDTIVLAAGDYALHFTNNTAFNVDNLTIVGTDNVNLAISSSEVRYGRIQGNNVTFENINFTTATIGATGKATYNECTFANRLECASSGSAETYANNCTMNEVHTSGDMTAGNAYFTECTIAKAEYAKPNNDITMTFTDCEIGEVIPWNVNTTLNGCDVTELDLSGVTTAIIMVDGVRVYPIKEYTVQGTPVEMSAPAYASIVNHDRAGYTDKVKDITVYTKEDMQAVVDLRAAGVMVHNGQNDIVARMIFGADIDFGGAEFTGLGNGIDIVGNGKTLSNVKFPANAQGQAGFISYAGNNVISDLTIKDVVVEGAQAGVFAGNASKVTVSNCALAGNVTVKYVDSDREDYNGVGVVFGVNAEGASVINVDVTGATINLITDGITYPGSFAPETATNLVGVVYGGSYTIN